MTTSVKGWIEEKIGQGYIRYFEYDEFSQRVEIGKGNFGKVFKADLANTGLVALKTIIGKNSNEINELNEANDEIVKELKLLREVDYHPKINRCLGITKDSDDYILVLEYANEGNLRDYLKKKFSSLKWNDRIQMALDITGGLKFLHSKKIIHRDLHSKNILVNNGKLLIADLGLSKKLAEIVTNSVGNRMGMVEYIEPQCFKNIKYKKDTRSDIYGLGVLLWEISSGRPPFSGCPRNLLSDHIKDGNREEPIEGTPPKYQQLYQRCWDDEPKSRPDIEEVHEILSQLNTEHFQPPQLIIDNIDSKSNSNDDNDLTIPSNYSSPALTTNVPSTKFVPLINEIGNNSSEAKKLTQAAEHNKRTCDALLKRVNAVNLSVQNLKNLGFRDGKEFFNNRNYLCLQDLTNIITRIKNFISEISQMKSLIKYIQAEDLRTSNDLMNSNVNTEKSIEKAFKELCKEFDSCVNKLSFPINIKTTAELGQLKADRDDLAKYLQEMTVGTKIDVKDLGDDANLSKGFSSTVVKVNTMNYTMNKFMNETSQNQKKIDNIFQVHPLKLSDYDRDDNERPRKNGRVTKWYGVKNKIEEFAFKEISEKEDQKIVQNQVTILKELHDWQNIIKFYGVVFDENKWYLVTEWAEYGNLREFYQNKKYNDDFDVELKLRISLDIVRGLNFLRTVEIVHRDIRAENILITHNKTAKLANFKLSRYLTAASLSQRQNLERVRYCAPELLERSPNHKYDQRCEVYSFGILLWEISEERIPYQDNNDIVDITDKVRNKMYREPFSVNSQMPEEFKQLEIEAVHHDSNFRPKITEMLEVLKNCYIKKQSSQDSSNPDGSNPSTEHPITKSITNRRYSIDQVDQDALLALPINLPDFESFNYMTLTDAAKQHKMVDRHDKLVGDIKTAYKCFEAYASLGIPNRNQIMAKYYKAYYISKGYVESPPNKEKILAELFKEVADDEANEFPEAKVRYASCLYYGKGVEQNFSGALKYFENAVKDGLKVAMYNAGNMYYNGIGCKKDREKAIRYMKLAAYSDYEPAIIFCKEHRL